MKIRKLFVLVISIVIGCLQKSETKKLSDLANMFQLEQLIKEPTRITSQSQTLIDLAFSNRPEIIIKSGVDHVGMSDHSLTYIHRKISIPRKQPKIINTRQFKHFNLEAYKQDLAKILQNQPQYGDPNILWEDWKRKFLLVADMHALQLPGECGVSMHLG